MIEGSPSKEIYVREQLTDLIRSWINFAIPLGIFIYLFLAILDYVVAPHYFKVFLIVRGSISGILALLWFLNNLKRNRVLQYAIVIVGTFLCAVAIEIMIVLLGGSSSSYYAGLGLLVISVLGFVPVDMWAAGIVVMEVFLVYLVPILLTQEITDPPLFVSNLFFLTSIFMISLAWRYLNQKKLLSELSLQYDLNQEREKLRQYSDELEKLVEQRTRELNKSERMLRSMFDNANDGILIMNFEGRIVDVNKRACEIYGFNREALLDTSIHLLEAEGGRTLWRERLRRILEGESLLFETTHYRKDGSSVILEVSASAVEIEEGVLIQAFIRDITEKKRIQEQLLHSQKMESVVVMAGGLAHDFNNMLSIILGYTELALADDDLSFETRQKLARVEKSARSAAQLVRKLLRFSRREKKGEPRPFNLNQVVQETLDLVSRNLPANVRVRTELCEEIPIVKGDIGDIEQVIINLVLNAKDAMPNGGEIVIRTEIGELPSEILEVERLKEGKYVHMSVSDTGVGIPPEILSRIFEPFFTTKEKGVGTGLGLAMVYGIVKDHWGHITVESDEGKGATFHVYLPLVTEVSPSSLDDLSDRRSGGENILVVDDDPLALELIKEVLQGRGYNVIATDKPLLGVKLFKSNLKKIDLVITDLAMPFMDGEKLLKTIKDMEPGAKFLVISGFLEEYKDLEADGVLRKPFDPIDLLSMVREILD
ncbi:MAG: hypothetical protein DRI91_02840 [Aquificota bacterium]|nr:MAG: hypothetical protein DRI91_02840 [Aquificota bacterium]